MIKLGFGAPFKKTRSSFQIGSARVELPFQPKSHQLKGLQTVCYVPKPDGKAELTCGTRGNKLWGYPQGHQLDSRRGSCILHICSVAVPPQNGGFLKWKAHLSMANKDGLGQQTFCEMGGHVRKSPLGVPTKRRSQLWRKNPNVPWPFSIWGW